VLSVFMGKQRSDRGSPGFAIGAFRSTASENGAAGRSRPVPGARDRPMGWSVKYRASVTAARRAIAAARKAGRPCLPRRGHDRARGVRFPMVPSRLVATAAEAIDTAHTLRYPVVLKAAQT
jgi:hypothetical protein